MFSLRKYLGSDCDAIMYLCRIIGALKTSPEESDDEEVVPATRSAGRQFHCARGFNYSFKSKQNTPHGGSCATAPIWSVGIQTLVYVSHHISV